MSFSWEKAFTKAPGIRWKGASELKGTLHLETLSSLKSFLDMVHIKFCLLKPYQEVKDYPLLDSRELLPSFEVDLFEYKELPGFSLVALERQLDYFNEVFQFDILHNMVDCLVEDSNGQACPVESYIDAFNVQTVRSRLPKKSQDEFLSEYQNQDVSALESYPGLLKYILQMERAHVMSLSAGGEFYFSGLYGSLPSDLDAEIKRFGLKIGKFRPGDNRLYERNRLFVYQFLMELYGFPIVSERRTSSALFARRMYRMGERFLVRVLGQSDRTITTLYSHPDCKNYPRIEKIGLISVDKEQKDVIKYLKENGFFVDSRKRVVILRVVYTQHKYNPNNVRQDRALSVLRQEVIHPLTFEAVSNLNIIKDTTNMILRLTDIVRGEYTGAVTYKRQEVVVGTDTHEKRLKFLYSWLSKHQRRIIGYSDEFYADVVKVLDSYLLGPENYDVFNNMHDLYQEVWSKYSYIQQARKVKLLEDLKDRNYKGEHISYLAMLRIINEVLSDLKFEIVSYFDQLVENVLTIGDEILNDSYVLRRYIQPPQEELTDYGRQVRKHYSRLVGVLDDFRAIRKSRTEQNPSVAEALRF
jgi:hypothetical protein